MKKNSMLTSKMPDSRAVVINTTPLIALSVATGSVEVLRTLYDRVIVPHEVQQEILAAGKQAPGVAAFIASEWLERLPEPQCIPNYLNNTLDRGEASVIQAALEWGIGRVCIDEKVGRRIARLNSLKVTGSIGILAKARQQGYQLDTDEVLARLRNHGIWLGKEIEQFLRDAQ
jgi:predicted nucleic acid-binding protein